MNKSMAIEPVRNLDHLEKLIRDAKNEYGFKNINCFLMPDDVELLLARGTLLFSATDAGLHIFNTQGSYYQLYLYLDSANPRIDIEPLDVEVVTDFPGMNEKLPVKFEPIINALEDAGFQYNVTSVRMTRSICPLDEIDYPLIEGFRMMVAKPQDKQRILELWSPALDSASNSMPGNIELDMLINRGNIILGLGNDTIIAAVQAEIKDNGYYPRHLAVDPIMRGKHIGTTMLLAAPHYLTEKSGVFATHWVQTKNAPSLAMCEKSGYCLDGRFLKQYVLKPQD